MPKCIWRQKNYSRMRRFVTVWLHRTGMGAAVSQNKHSVNNTVISWNNTLIIKLFSAQTIASYLWFAVGSCTSGAGKQGRCGARGRRISAPRFARGRGRRCWAGNQLRARSGRCAGIRDVVTRAWPGSSYSWEWIGRDLRGRPAGSFGAAGLGLDPD